MSIEDLTAGERELVLHVKAGQLFKGSDLVPEELEHATEEQFVIRASVLRQLALGQLVARPDPLGIRLEQAHISGTLDLRNAQCIVGIEATDCFFSEPVQLSDGALPWLNLDGSHLPGIEADGVRVDRSVFLRGVKVRGSGEAAVRFLGASIAGTLECNGAEFSNDNGVAFACDSARIEGDLFLRDGFFASAKHVNGSVRLLAAQIGGNLECRYARMTNRAGPALVGDRLQVLGSADFNNLEAQGSGEFGVVNLPGAHIHHEFNCSGGRLLNKTGPVLNAERLQVGGDLYLSAPFLAQASSDDGALLLSGAQIGGVLQCDGAHIRNDEGPAIKGDGVQTEASVFLDSICAVGSGESGTVRLPRGRIGGVLQCNDAALINRTGPALLADGVTVAGDIFLRGLRARGHHQDGTIRLLGATVGGSVECDKAEFKNRVGTAFFADNMQVTGHLFLRAGFGAASHAEDAAVRVVASTVGRALDLAGAQLSNDAGLVLDLRSTTVASVDLPPAALNRSSGTTPQPRGEIGGLDIDGFIYGDIDGLPTTNVLPTAGSSTSGWSGCVTARRVTPHSHISNWRSYTRTLAMRLKPVEC